jgi:predicted N-acyltransferase
MSGLKFKISGSIDEIPRETWNELFGTELIESHGFQKAIEDSGMKEFKIGYLLAYRADKITAIMPFFIMEFSFDVFLPAPFKAIIRLMQKRFNHFMKMRILFLGSPVAEEFYPAFARDEDLDEILSGTMDFLRGYSRKNRIDAYLFNNVGTQHAGLINFMEKHKFIRLETVPTTRLQIKAKSVDEFIAGLGPSTRKDLRRKIRKTEVLAELKTELREDVSDIVDEINRLYRNNLDDSEVQFETLTRSFFKDICAHMPGVAKYFITYNKGRIVSFNLLFAKGDTCIDKFIGFNRQVAREYNLYYMTFLHNIDWCIKNGYRFYQPGSTDYHPKVRLGAKLIPLFIYADSTNWFLKFIFRALRGYLEPKRLDPSLRKIEQLKSSHKH